VEQRQQHNLFNKCDSAEQRQLVETAGSLHLLFGAVSAMCLIAFLSGRTCPVRLTFADACEINDTYTFV
jgi:hypothetical protein